MNENHTYAGFIHPISIPRNDYIQNDIKFISTEDPDVESIWAGDRFVTIKMTSRRVLRIPLSNVTCCYE